jgi:hypothetical protein
VTTVVPHIGANQTRRNPKADWLVAEPRLS